MLVKIMVPKEKNLGNVGFLMAKDQNQRSVCPLCYTCMLTQNKNCKHESENDRAWCLWVVIPELIHALSLGYRLLAIFRAKIYVNLQPIFHDFLSVIASLKLQSDSISEEFKNRKTELASHLNRLMKFEDSSTTLTADNLWPNSGLRNSAKARG